jgi:hypothetical protein
MTDENATVDPNKLGLARLRYHAQMLTLLQVAQQFAAQSAIVADAAREAYPSGEDEDVTTAETAARVMAAMFREAAEKAPGLRDVFLFAAGSRGGGIVVPA